ncbi:MAG: NAD(P)-dependent oxidoreductase [Chitinophagaceae bacterium]|nr:NAD(P)-dependent oxidoreductase [Chitinophagaceae bacterium]
MPGAKKNILVTGGLGNLGSWVTDHFSGKDDYTVYVLTKNDRSVDIAGSYTKLFGDISDMHSLLAGLGDHKFDYIVHLASINESFLEGYPKQALLVNAYGTRNLLEACAGRGVKKFIYMSTFHVYGRNGGLITEDDEVRPLNDYAITHYFAEEYIRMFSQRSGMPYLILRLSNSYGCPKDVNSSKWYLLFNDLCRQAALKGKIEINTNGTALRDFIHMQDVSMVIDWAIDAEELKDRVINLGSGQSVSLTRIADHIADAYRQEYEVEINISKNESDATVHPSSLTFSIEKLRKAIGFNPTFCYTEEAGKIFRFIKQHAAAFKNA